jgi:SAM-dependent methyltransferase
MAARDVYLRVDEWDDSTTRRIIERLEFRGKDPTFRGWLEAYLDKLALKPSARVLVLGCGTGVEVRSISARLDSSGCVIGVDHSRALIEAARRFAAQDGVRHRVEFCVGDVHSLDYPDAGFDAVVAHTLLSHVRDPLAVLKEAARLSKPHGQIAVFDGDYASWTFGYSDPDFAKRMDEALVASIVNNPRVMRTLSRLLPQAGLKLEEATPPPLCRDRPRQLLSERSRELRAARVTRRCIIGGRGGRLAHRAAAESRGGDLLCRGELLHLSGQAR